jgi:hypothetical protein
MLSRHPALPLNAEDAEENGEDAETKRWEQNKE